MFLQKKNILQQVFRRKSWIILAIALVIFVSFTTTVVYEQYVMNQDNLAQYLPADTVFYLHGNTLKSSFVYRSFADFIVKHPRFKAVWLEDWEDRYLSLWPPINGSDHQEIAFALVPRADGFQPIMLLFLKSDKGIGESIVKWQVDGWQVSRIDDVVAVSRQSFFQWNTGKANLARILAKKKIPLANQFYAYMDVSNYKKWLPQITNNSYLFKMFEYWGDSQSLYAFIRDNNLLITDNPSILGEGFIKEEQNWVDGLNETDSLALKNIDLRQVADFMLENNSFFAGTVLSPRNLINKMRIKYDFDVLNDLILKLDGPANIYIKGMESFVLDQGKQVAYILDLPVSDSFVLANWEEFLKNAASFSFPVEVEKKLPDGSSYKVMQARANKDINISREEMSTGIVLNYVTYQDLQWDWYYIYTQGRLRVANNRDLLVSTVLSKARLTQAKSRCPIVENKYIKFFPSFLKAGKLGFNKLMLSQGKSGSVLCIQ